VPRKAKWAYLLEEDSNFRRWYENLSRGSEVTAKENARVLYRFLTKHDLDPQRLVELARKDRKNVEDILSDFVTVLHGEGKAPGYIANYLKAVKSWLEFNEVRLLRRIKVGNRNIKTTIMDERVPNRDELRTILLHGSERVRCSIGLMAFSGLRPRVMGNSSGTDGLRLLDLPELELLGDRVEFSKVPMMIVVKPQLSKTGHKYITFLTSEGCEYLKVYLEKRISQGEVLTKTSPVISVKRGYERKGKSSENIGSRFIVTKNITREIRNAIRPKYDWRPYVLRGYFATQLMIAENHGKISHTYRQFFMGHKGDMESAYTTNKGRLPQEVIEDMRQTFSRCSEYLSTTPDRFDVDLEKAKIESLLSFAKLQGLPEEKINSIRQTLTESENPTADKAIELLSDYANLKSIFWVTNPTINTPSDTKPGEANHTVQEERPFEAQIVTESELTDFLECGFDLVADIGDGKYVVRRKNHKRAILA